MIDEKQRDGEDGVICLNCDSLVFVVGGSCELCGAVLDGEALEEMWYEQDSRAVKTRMRMSGTSVKNIQRLMGERARGER